MYYVYLLRSLNFNKTYIGSTKDLKRRLKEHNSGKSFSTKPYLPWKLVYYEAFEFEESARLRENKLKYNGNAMRELKKRIFLRKSGAGYTLIEILVGLTIIAILFALGYVNFRGFAQRQVLASAAKSLQGDIRLAQQLALSGQKPDDPNCNGANILNGWRFGVNPPNDYRVRADCTAGPAVPLKDIILPPDITISISAGAPNPIIFKVLGEGTNIPAGTTVVITLTQLSTNLTYTTTVGAGGNVY